MPKEFLPLATSTDGQPSWIAPVKPVVPDHELVRRIGGGSYGDVWLARTAVGTWRAVKVVFRDRFRDSRPYEREFRGIQKFEPLSRANEAFVDILQIGRNEVQGYFYYVMELADDAVAESDPPAAGGETSETPAIHSSRATHFLPDSYVPRTLSKVLLQRGRLPVSECLELGLTLNLGLAHLHKAALIHRDIKPSNIIFVGGVPKLADIGLVVEMGAARSFVGTEGFIPPEGPNSAQADLYSLGKVLYEAGMGKDRKDFPEPFTKIADAVDAAQLVEFNAVLLKACAANREDRYQSAEGMNADLALLQSGGSVRRQRKLARQLRLVQRMVTLTAVLALLIGAGWWWQARQTAVVQALAKEKTSLAGTLAGLDKENRNRIVRLDIANGSRLLDQGDPAGALLWFVDALPLLKDNPSEASVHRIRVQQTLDQTPRVLRIYSHDSAVVGGAFSPDGELIATATQAGDIRVWDAQAGRIVWGPRKFPSAASYIRFSKDGQKLLASSSEEQGFFNGGRDRPHECFAVLEAHTGQFLFPHEAEWAQAFTNVICAHFSPDDRWLAVSEVNNAIRVYDLQTGGQAAALRGHTDEVRFLSFSADSTLMASASLDRTVRFWRLPSGESVGEPLEHRWPVVRALLTADGKRVVSASFAKPGSAGLAEESESEIQGWDVRSGRKLGAPIAGGGWVTMFVAPPGEDRFFTKRGGTNLQSFKFENPEPEVFQSRLRNYSAWAFTRDGRRVALAGDFGAQVCDARTGIALSRALRHGQWAQTVGFSPDENQLLTTSADGCARLWDLRPGQSRSVSKRLPAPMAFILSTAMVRQLGRRLGGVPLNLTDQTVRIIDEELHEVERFSSEIPGKQASSPTRAWRSNMWAILQLDQGSTSYRTIVIWNGEITPARKLVIQSPAPVVENIFTFDDRFLVTYSSDRRVRFWQTSDGKLDRTVELTGVMDGRIAALSPDGRTAVWVHLTRSPGNAQMQFLDLKLGTTIGAAVDLLPGTADMVFSPNATRLAVMDVNGPVTIVETRTGRLVSTTIAHSSILDKVWWSPDGKHLLTVGYGEEVLVWNAEAGTQALGPLRDGVEKDFWEPAYGRELRRARWSPDGRFIVTYNKQGQLRVWDAATGERITPPLKQPGFISFAFMTPKQRVIAGILPDQLLALDLQECPLSSDVIADYAKLLSGRELNSAGVMLLLPPKQLTELNRSLLARAPQLFQ